MKKLYTRLPVLSLFALLSLFIVSKNSLATTHIINTVNYAFSPNNLTVTLGDTLKWQWLSGNHTTTSVTIPVGATPWNANLKLSIQTFIYVPAVIGSYHYKCTPHEITKGMVGDFTVICPAPSVTISEGGPTTFCTGGSVTLSTNGVYSSHQWKKGGVDIAGATDNSYSATASGDYTLAVTNSCGSSATSNGITVTVNPKPKAKATPAGPIDICAGQTVTLSVTTGVNLVFQWKKGNMNIAGATNSTVDVGAAGMYKCMVTNSVTGCKKTSNAITVNVTCKSQGVPLEVTVSPNPSADYFVMNTLSLMTKSGIIYVYDVTGKLMERHTIEGETTDIGKNLPKGMFFAKVEVNGEVKQVLKLMKN